MTRNKLTKKGQYNTMVITMIITIAVLIIMLGLYIKFGDLCSIASFLC